MIHFEYSPDEGFSGSACKNKKKILMYFEVGC